MLGRIVRRLQQDGLARTVVVARRLALLKLKNAQLHRRLMRELATDGMAIIERQNLTNIRLQTLSFVESLRAKDLPYGHYTHSHEIKQPTLYSSAYAALVRDLYGDLQVLSDESRRQWVNYLQDCQCSDGLFRANEMRDLVDEDCPWFGWQHLTVHVLMALAALGANAKKPLRLIEPFRDQKYMQDWLESRAWDSDPASVSNEVQNIGTFLQYSRDIHEVDWAANAMSSMYAWLDKHQNVDSGSWGKFDDTPHGLSLSVQTAYHILLLYFYDERPVGNAENILKCVLQTQNQLGGWAPHPNSSACEDIDSIDPLTRMANGSVRYQQINDALLKTIPWVMTNMNEDGGFVFRRHDAYTLGHQYMTAKADVSILFPTWFRTLSLAYLGKALPASFVGGYQWRFLTCPGYQFFRDTDIATKPQHHGEDYAKMEKACL